MKETYRELQKLEKIKCINILSETCCLLLSGPMYMFQTSSSPKPLRQSETNYREHPWVGGQLFSVYLCHITNIAATSICGLLDSYNSINGANNQIKKYLYKNHDPMMIVQFRPYCQAWRLGPLDLTH